MKRCTLCGGKLDHKRRCTFCGLDNTKNDEMYHRMVNRSECEGKPLTHVHEEKKTQPKAKSTQRKEPTKTGCVGSIIKGFLLLSLISSLLSGVFSGVLQKGYDLVQEVFVGEITYDTVLEPGIYEAGVHIPCAKYTMEYESDSFGTVEIRNFTGDFPETAIYYATSDQERDQIVLDAEDLIIVAPDTYVRIYTREEVGDTLMQNANPLKEIVEVEWNAISGTDFAPGVYDLVYDTSEADTDGSASVSIYIWDEEVGIVTYQTVLYLEAYTEESSFCNIPLSSGSEIIVEGAERVFLIPSNWVSPTWEIE